MAWDSKDGELIKLNNNESFMSCILNCLNTTAYKTTSYKYGLLKAILDNLYNCNDYRLSFDDLLWTFAKIYWNIIVKYDLPQKQLSAQGNLSSMEIIINEIEDEFKFVEKVDFDSLKEEIRKMYINKSRSVIVKYVIGALYSDLNGKIYGFTKKDSYIYFSQESYNFLSENKVVIEKLNYYSWIIWTEKILDKQENGINNVAIKLDLSTKRNSLLEYKKRIFAETTDYKCFYCDSRITADHCHIDHFIPWSFVKDDKIWNLVSSCSKCNLRKNDKIPSNKYLNKLFLRNMSLIGNSYEDNLKKLYNAALFNGFTLWEEE